jgi:phage tail-like protein
VDPVGFGQLSVVQGGRVTRTRLLDKPLITIGATPDNDLRLGGAHVSPRHAELRFSALGAHLTDLGSESGTRMAGQHLAPHQPYPILDGQSFEIGSFAILFRAARTEAAPEPGDVHAHDAEAASEEVPGPFAPPKPPRRKWPSESLSDEREALYLRFLPDLFRDNDFLGRYLKILETVWEPLEWRQDHLPMYFDPQTCPAEFLAWLGTWLDFRVEDGRPEGRMRQVLAAAMDLQRWRGTRYGLATLLELCVGVRPHIGGTRQPGVFRVKFVVGEGCEPDVAEITRLVETFKPAHAGYILEIRR